MRPTLGQGWTLVYEMFFYLCFGLCLLTSRKKGMTILFTTFAALTGLGSFSLMSGDHFRDATNIIEFYGSPIILLFLIGILLSMWHDRAIATQISTSHALISAAIVVGFQCLVIINRNFGSPASIYSSYSLGYRCISCCA